MSQRLLIAYDRNTVGLADEYDHIYDEFSTLEEMASTWVDEDRPQIIVILDANLFPKFKKDFLALCKSVPALVRFGTLLGVEYWTQKKKK